MGIILNVKIYDFFEKFVPFCPYIQSLNKENIGLII